MVIDPKYSNSVHGHAFARSLAGTDADLFDSCERIIESCEQCQQAEPKLCDVLVLAAARACTVASLAAAASRTGDAVQHSVPSASTSEPQRHVRHAHARGLLAVSDQLGNDHVWSRTVGRAGSRAVRVVERTASRWVARAEHVRSGPYTPQRSTPSLAAAVLHSIAAAAAGSEPDDAAGAASERERHPPAALERSAAASRCHDGRRRIPTSHAEFADAAEPAAADCAASRSPPAVLTATTSPAFRRTSTPPRPGTFTTCIACYAFASAISTAASLADFDVGHESDNA